MAQRRLPLRNRTQPTTSRSFLLDDFKGDRYESLQLTDIVSHVVEFASDADGSKFIQIKLNDATDSRKEMIFREMRPYLRRLMSNTFGNFVVQKFFDIGTMRHKLDIIEEIRFNFQMLSLHKYGCRVVQKAIESSSMQYLNYLLQVIDRESAIRLAKDSSGNHVIQKIFRVAPLNIQDMVFAHFIGNIFDMSLDLYGCRVIQCIFERGTPNQRQQIFEEISGNPRHLIEHRYGNYVIQFALRYGSILETNALIDSIIENIVHLSQQKYASNVVEMCLEIASPQARNRALELLCSNGPEESKRLCLDGYANYVIQKLIQTVDIFHVQNLFVRVEPFFKQMRRHVSGRNVVNELLKRLGLQHSIR